MDSKRLLYFKAAAETESLTKAAEKLYISQPALSKSLASTEEELGTKLFDRRGGRLFLNEQGRILLKYADEMDDLLHRIDAEFAEMRNKSHSLCVYSFGNYFSFIMKDFFQYNTQPVRLKVLPVDELIDSFICDEADVIIADDECVRGRIDTGIKRIPLLSEQLLLKVPKNHPLASRRRVNISELEPYSIMATNTNYWLPQIVEKNNVKINLRWMVDSETWNYYWSNASDEIPLCFDTSASFTTHEQLQERKRKCDILQVNGKYTNRMLYVWYKKSKEKEMQDFLKCIKQSFC